MKEAGDGTVNKRSKMHLKVCGKNLNLARVLSILFLCRWLDR